jgi:nucleotide-binding universal stress UspA family protein
MYQHILIPTDGTRLSAKATKTGLTLAKALGARVTAFYASPEYPTPVYAEGAAFAPHVSKTVFSREHEAHARKILGEIHDRGARLGVTVEPEHSFSDTPYQAILKAARRRKCDLIVMASHGRRGLSALLLGSETQKVLTHSKVPVLVVR